MRTARSATVMGGGVSVTEILPGQSPPLIEPPARQSPPPRTGTPWTETPWTKTPMAETRDSPRCGQTNTSKKITFPQLCLRAVITSFDLLLQTKQFSQICNLSLNKSASFISLKCHIALSRGNIVEHCNMNQLNIKPAAASINLQQQHLRH